MHVPDDVERLVLVSQSIYVANADLSCPKVVSLDRWLGCALGLFGLSCLVGSAAGVLVEIAVLLLVNSLIVESLFPLTKNVPSAAYSRPWISAV